MNRFDTLEELLQEADAYEILHQIIQNMSNTEGIVVLKQAAVDLGIEDIDEDDDDEEFDDYYRELYEED